MSKQRQKERKKKNKERENYASKIKRQTVMQKAAKEKKLAAIAEAAAEPRLTPVRRDNPKNALKSNIQVLKALEEEWLETQRKRTDLNESLEKEGFKTLEEKLEALKTKSRAIVDALKDDSIPMDDV